MPHRNIKLLLAYRLLFILFLSGLGLSVFAQNDTVRLRFSITDSYTKRGVKGANVVNRTTGAAATTDINGYVETKVGRHDQLYIFATGYKALPFSVADSTSEQPYFLHLVIEPFTAGLNQSVIITGSKSLDRIGDDKRALGKTPPELKKPKIPITNVLAQMYDKFGAEGREREALKKQMVSDDRWKVMTEYLNYCNEKQLINLPEDHFGDFINFCDMSIAYLKVHADYEILVAITNKFEAYAKERGLPK